ncbi:hypothetical protein GCM10010191_15770 [Actinomadura vinacea]|uniref:Uncharacterized protein n=1 Tax=Actinomadura vinacea TaxID=115336 RepID=A0ABN3ILV2_9ACTN
MIEARDTGESQASRPDGGQDFWPEDKKDGKDGPGRRAKSKSSSSRSRTPLIIAVVAVVVLAAAGVAGFLVLGGGDEKASGAPGNGARLSPVAYTPQMADKDMAKLAQRSADQRPITQGEAFPGDVKTVAYQKYSFTLAASQLANDCKSVTWGQRLQGDLAKYQCSQIARGAYVSQDRGHVGQFIAINLASQEGAEQIVRDLDPGVGAGFVFPLTAKGAPEFRSGFSAAYAQAYGHYAIVTWVQRAGGAQPASLNEMIDASLAIEKPADFVWGRLELADGTPR